MMNDNMSASSSRKQSTASMKSACNDPPLHYPEMEESDRLHVEVIKKSMRYYGKYALARINKSEIYINSMVWRHQDKLLKYKNHLNVLRDCVRINQSVINKMLRDDIPCGGENGDADPSSSYHNGRRCSAAETAEAAANIKLYNQDIEKVQSTLKCFARDWSSAGAEEREQAYRPIIDAIEEFYKPEDYAVNEIKILVPGAGLGRLTYELACRGYECEGNEFSLYMMIASNFVLNKCTSANQYALHPWVHMFDNNLCRADQVAAITFPDVCPTENPPKGISTMSAGDFLEIFQEPRVYDCVATCFFIDCAKNIIEFIETIYRILVPGGIWVNLGPLLYHYSGMANENSIEPTFEDIVDIITMTGFEIVRSKTDVRTKYAQNPKSMLKSEYESLFWICRKPINAANDEIPEDECRIQKNTQETEIPWL